MGRTQRVRSVTDYICPVAVCNEQGGGGVKERKCLNRGKSRQKPPMKRDPKMREEQTN